MSATNSAKSDQPKGTMSGALVEVRGLRASYQRGGVATLVLRGLDLVLASGNAVALVGRSGCGKSTLARCLLGLHPIDAGTVVFSGRDITHLSERVRRPLRRHMQFIFQAPRAAVDPRQRVDQIVGEPLATFGLVPRAARPERVERLLDRVGLEAGLGSSYPHELSGGQLQRVCIARALASGPRLLVADEPTSALDLVAQARVLHLLSKLRDEGLALLFITHNLRLVPTFCDDVAVMDDGVIVERLAAQDLAASTSPPTRALLDALG